MLMDAAKWACFQLFLQKHGTANFQACKAGLTHKRGVAVFWCAAHMTLKCEAIRDTCLTGPGTP